MPELKPFTLYECHDCGKSSRWTGAYLEVHRRENDDRCSSCGSLLVEHVADGLWKLSWESVSAMQYPELYDWRTERARADIDRERLADRYWSPVSKEHDTERGARDQLDGLNQLIAEGEFIRNVRLEKAASPEWEPVE